MHPVNGITGNVLALRTRMFLLKYAFAAKHSNHRKAHTPMTHVHPHWQYPYHVDRATWAAAADASDASTQPRCCT